MRVNKISASPLSKINLILVSYTMVPLLYKLVIYVENNYNIVRVKKQKSMYTFNLKNLIVIYFSYY